MPLHLQLPVDLRVRDEVHSRREPRPVRRKPRHPPAVAGRSAEEVPRGRLVLCVLVLVRVARLAFGVLLTPPPGKEPPEPRLLRFRRKLALAVLEISRGHCPRLPVAIALAVLAVTAPLVSPLALQSRFLAPDAAVAQGGPARAFPARWRPPAPPPAPFTPPPAALLLLVLLLLFGLALRRASNPFKRAPAGGVGLAGLALLLVGLEPRLLRARLDLVVVLDQVASLVGLLVCDPHLALHRLLLEDAVHLRLPLLDLGTHGLHSLVGHHSPLHHAGRPAYDVLEHLLGARRVIREGDSLPALPRARRPADAMHVVSQVTRHLEVDDRLHICDVETASGEVSGDEEVDFPRAEGFE
mmetsp:Transcript_64247/g.147227  ORF Transcript_64247/g.147227 Transcript_64247/m.147227 type:complete len:355 (-) Transcript_64247:1073-2137(-)